MNYDYLQVSDGTGDAALMHVETERAIGSSTINVDITTHVPQKFIASSGPALASGFIDPSKKTDFRAHLSGGDIIIDGYEPGSSDIGHKEGDLIVIRPNTGWTNRVASIIASIKGIGTAIDAAFGALTATSLTTTADATIGGNETVTGNITINGTSRLVPGTTATADGSNNITPSKQMFNVTALDKNATIVVPSFTPYDGLTGELQILDNGTARTLTWPSGWLAIGVTLPTATIAGKYLYINYRYNAADGKYHVRGVARQ